MGRPPQLAASPTPPVRPAKRPIVAARCEPAYAAIAIARTRATCSASRPLPSAIC